MHSEEWIYGLNPVIEALRSGRNIKAVYLASGRHEKVMHIRKEAEERGVFVEVADASFFNRRFPKGHQGIAAKAIQKSYISINDLLLIPPAKDEAPLFIILDSIEDPRNFGAILRSADAAGVHGVIIQSYRSVSLGPEVSKTSSGAAEYVPVSVVANIKHAIRAMKEEGITVIGAEAGGHPAIWEKDLNVPLAIVIGSEGKGIRKTVAENCDFLVSLPMKGKINSLNVSVASGIFLFEIMRQRSFKKNKQ